MANELFDLWGAMRGSSYKRVLSEMDALIRDDTNDFTTIIKKLLEKVNTVFRCEAYTFWIYQLNEDGLIKPLAFTGGSDISGIRLFPGEGIVGKVIKTGESIIIEDCLKEASFKKDVDKKTGFITKTMICVPTKSEDVTYGAIQMINRKDNSFFDDVDLKMAEEVAEKISKLLEEHNTLRDYFGYNLAEIKKQILKESGIKNVGIAFIDVVGFHQLAAKVSMEAFGDIYNSYLQFVNNIVVANGGVIDTTMTDDIELLFGLNEQEDVAYKTLKCAVDLIDKFKDFKKVISTKYGIDMNISITCDYGKAYCTYLGSDDSRRYTSIGYFVKECQVMSLRVDQKNTTNKVLIGSNLYEEVTNNHIVYTKLIKGKLYEDQYFDAYLVEELVK